MRSVLLLYFYQYKSSDTPSNNTDVKSRRALFDTSVPKRVCGELRDLINRHFDRIGQIKQKICIEHPPA